MPLLLTPEDYRKTPWKNGNGVTEDVLLLPQGSSHEDFDIRISRAPIVDESRFSAFPGIDRTITRVGENPLSLRFEDGGEVELAHLVPYGFDSALAPNSRLSSGSSQVMNVMTRRGRWQSYVSVLHGMAHEVMDVPQAGMLFVHAVRGSCGVGAIHVADGQTLIVQGPAKAEVALSDRAACLFAIITPADSR
jgi:environmental stress-induced protein Ves